MEYQYAIGLTAGGTQARDWTSVGNNITLTTTGLSLQLEKRYYISVKTKNGAGKWSAGERLRCMFFLKK